MSVNHWIANSGDSGKDKMNDLPTKTTTTLHTWLYTDDKTLIQCPSALEGLEYDVLVEIKRNAILSDITIDLFIIFCQEEMFHALKDLIISWYHSFLMEKKLNMIYNSKDLQVRGVI